MVATPSSLGDIGSSPADVTVSETGLLAKLTRSKVSSPDKILHPAGRTATAGEGGTSSAGLCDPVADYFSSLQRIFRASTGHCYTSHSGRNFMPSATAVLNSSKSDRDVLGGWSAEGSDRYSRAAKFKIASMQTAVAPTFRSSDPDPLGEAEHSSSVARQPKSREKSLWPGWRCRSCSWRNSPDDELDEGLAMKKK